ncbi:hypothetical protein C8R44DRAFT_733888 [Mycena epipterygia]|nr:hypothetical protein C8R44DRAFT_733888 [Mycena epipterygia]
MCGGRRTMRWGGSMMYPAGSISETARARDLALGYYGTVPPAMWAANGLEAEVPFEGEQGKTTCIESSTDHGLWAVRRRDSTQRLVGMLEGWADSAQRRHVTPHAEDAQGERGSRKHRRCHQYQKGTIAQEQRWALDARVYTADSSGIEEGRKADETELRIIYQSLMRYIPPIDMEGKESRGSGQVAMPATQLELIPLSLQVVLR